jgi:hypothetical protein
MAVLLSRIGLLPAFDQLKHLARCIADGADKGWSVPHMYIAADDAAPSLHFNSRSLKNPLSEPYNAYRHHFATCSRLKKSNGNLTQAQQEFNPASVLVITVAPNRSLFVNPHQFLLIFK